MQSNELAERIARWMMWGVVAVFSGIALMLMTFLLGGSIIDKFGDASLPMWMAALALCYCVALWMVGKRLLNSIVAPPSEIELKNWSGRLVGGMRGLLVGGIVSLVIFAVAWLVKPACLYTVTLRAVFAAVFLCGAALGAIRFPAHRIFRRERIWLAVTLAAGIFLAHLLVWVFVSFCPVLFDYHSQTAAPQAFPHVSTASLKKILPPEAIDVHLWGRGGYAPLIEWECSVAPEYFTAFAAANDYQFTPNDSIREVNGVKYDLCGSFLPVDGKKPEKFDFYSRFAPDGSVVTLMFYDRTTGRLHGITR